ncbi:MAG: GerAB/ArcD/ProY family transporter [Clostridia bacterium]|nr:GerAB/ArcD/ProY family transporter [Clostridia bacterium]
MNNSKLNNLEAIGLLSIIMANKVILNLPELIISSTGSAAWLNTIYITVIAFIFLSIILKLMNHFPEFDILDISEYIGGSFLKFVVGIFQIILLFFIANIVIRSFSYTLKTIYFTQSPILFIVLFMVVPVLIANTFGLKSISKICLYVVPIAYIGLVILLLAPVKDFEFQRIFPILGYGIDATFFSGISNLFALSGLGYIFLLPQNLGNNTNIKKITTISLALSVSALFFSILCMLFTFSYHVNPNENMNLYLLTMVVHHGNVIHGINILFMIIWILSIIAYISTTVFFILFILKKLGRLKYTNSLNYSFSSLFLSSCIVFQNYPQFYFVAQSFMEHVILYFVFLLEPLLFIIAIIKHKIQSSLAKKTMT